MRMRTEYTLGGKCNTIFFICALRCLLNPDEACSRKKKTVNVYALVKIPDKKTNMVHLRFTDRLHYGHSYTADDARQNADPKPSTAVSIHEELQQFRTIHGRF